MLSSLSASVLIALTTLTKLSIALPHHPLPRAPPSYSIVNVDGGRPPSTATIVQTVLAPAPTIDDPPTPPATETILHTVVVTSSAPQQTVVVTFEPAGPSSTSTSTSSSSSSTPPAVSIVTAIETALQPAATQYYDDGMWKTSYPVKSFEEAVPVTSASEAVLLPTAAVESVTASTFVTLPTPVASLL